MKRLATLVIVTCMAILKATPLMAKTVDLIADGPTDHIVVGTVEVTETSVIFKITEPGWVLTETHLAITESLEEIPQTGSGNPKVGKFTILGDTGGVEHDPPVTIYTYNVDFETGKTYYIAAHAAVKLEWCADFSSLDDGESVEGLGMVYPGLNISATGNAVKLIPDGSARVFGAPNNKNCHPGESPDYPANGCIDPDGGFADLTGIHEYDFTFEGKINKFSLHMLDFGDYNPSHSLAHEAVMLAFDADDSEVDVHVLMYDSDGKTNPTDSYYGNLLCGAGDGCDADEGDPGNWTWMVEGSDIVKVILRFPLGLDPKIGFDTLCTHRQESAWADGERLTTKGNWATYFTCTIPCVEPDGSLTITGTGWKSVDAWCPCDYKYDLTETGSPIALEGLIDVSEAAVADTGDWSKYYAKFSIIDSSGHTVEVVFGNDWLGPWYEMAALPWDRIRMENNMGLALPSQYYATVGGTLGYDMDGKWVGAGNGATVYPSDQEYFMQLIIDPVTETFTLYASGMGSSAQANPPDDWPKQNMYNYPTGLEIGTIDVSGENFDFTEVSLCAKL